MEKDNSTMNEWYQTPVAETESFGEALYLVHEATQSGTQQLSRVLYGYKGIGKTKYFNYLNDHSSNFISINSISDDPLFSAFNTNLRDNQKYNRIIWPFFWKFIILCKLLDKLHALSLVSEELLPILKILSSFGFLSSRKQSSTTSFLKRIFKSIRKVGPVEFDFNELFSQSSLFGINVDDELKRTFVCLTRSNIVIDIGIDGLDKLSSIDNEVTAEPTSLGISICTGLLQALYELNSSLSHFNVVSVYAFFRKDIYLLAVNRVPEKTHIISSLRPVELQWNLDQIKQIVIYHLEGCEGCSKLKLITEYNNEADYLFKELALTQNIITPREAIDAFNFIQHSKGTRKSVDHNTVNILCSKEIIRDCINYVARKRLDDTLSSLGVDISNCINNIRPEFGIIKVNDFIRNWPSQGIDPPIDIIEMRIHGLGIAEVVNGIIIISPLYCHAYDLLPINPRTRTEIAFRYNYDKKNNVYISLSEIASNYTIDIRCIKNRSNRLSLSEEVITYLNDDTLHGLLTILGDYGSGKTTFMSSLYCMYYELYDIYPFSFMLPIYINLKYYKDFEVHDEFWSAVLKEHGVICDSFESALSFFNSKNCLLLLDSFDEMSFRPSEDVIYSNASLIKSISSNVKTILTSRPHLFTGWRELNDFIISSSGRFQKRIPKIAPGSVILENIPENTLIIERLDWEDAISLFSKRGIEPDTIKWIEDTYSLKELSQTPIFLTMIADTAEELKNMNKEEVTSSDIYELYTKHWLADNLLNAYHGDIDEDKMVTILSNIAFDMYTLDTDVISIGDFNKAFSKIINIEDDANPWRSVHGGSFLIFDNNSDMARFSHESFREFFVAVAIYREIEIVNNFEARKYCQDYWTYQVDQFLIGLLKNNGITGIIGEELVSSKSINVRMNCATTIGRWENPSSINMLKHAFEIETDIGVAGRIAEALFYKDEKEYFWYLLRNIKNYDRSAEDTGKDVTQKLLYDTQGELITEVPSDISSVIKEVILGKNQRLAKWAIYMAGRLGLTDCRAEIEEKYNIASSQRMKLYIIASLGRLGDSRSIEKLINWRKHENSESIIRRIDASLIRLTASITSQ